MHWTRREMVAGVAVSLIGLRLPAQKKAPLPPEPPLTGEDAESAIRALKPGQFLWAPSLAPSGPILAIVSLSLQRCYVYRNGVLIAVSTLSSGKTGHETPTGVFTVLQKQVMHHSNLYDNAPMPYMQRLTWGGIALHAGNLPGYPASHGCVRLPKAFAQKLYGETKLGMTVVVTDSDAVPRIAPAPNLLEAAQAVDQNTLAGGVVWRPEKSPTGPMSLVLSGADKRLMVLRNGVLIGSCPVTIDGPIAETMGFTLKSIEGADFRWLQLPLPGQTLSPGQEMSAAERARVRMPEEFRLALDRELTPGVTLLVTQDSMRASSAGTKVMVFESGSGQS
ncbi:L,D-transpeptidase [Terriglobus roseus]|uniref:Lipoprotein-anchoring transpeptidase ErfK/SrfK n=1 Tax=Terriglobus roseus TaxID=392734 RepID=A0A1G7LQL9_9BACT|nr:L,D-transpeptidase [Terriglobus roseus]SDF51269.1 Lipoprotein-anchoring transpeptidase ErfK/SrfK [Terriglobus roseus]